MNEFELCPRFEKAVSILSQRWTALILYQLMAGPQRFCTMTDKLGVSGKTLSERLKDLEQQGFVIRTRLSRNTRTNRIFINRKRKVSYTDYERN